MMNVTQVSETFDYTDGCRAPRYRYWNAILCMGIQEKVSSMTKTFVGDAGTSYTFEPMGAYGRCFETRPVIIDFELWVNLTIKNANGFTKRFPLICLGGSIVRLVDRRFIPFGDEYFEVVERQIVDILCETWEQKNKAKDKDLSEY